MAAFMGDSVLEAISMFSKLHPGALSGALAILAFFVLPLLVFAHFAEERTEPQPAGQKVRWLKQSAGTQDTVHVTYKGSDIITVQQSNNN